MAFAQGMESLFSGGEGEQARTDSEEEECEQRDGVAA